MRSVLGRMRRGREAARTPPALNATAPATVATADAPGAQAKPEREAQEAVDASAEGEREINANQVSLDMPTAAGSSSALMTSPSGRGTGPGASAAPTTSATVRGGEDLPRRSRRGTLRTSGSSIRGMGMAMLHLRRHESSFLDASNQAGSETDGEEMDEEDLMLEEIPMNPICCMWCLGGKFRTVMFAVGISLIGVGIVFDLVLGDKDGSRAFCISGAILCCGLLSTALVLAVVSILNALLRRTKGDTDSRSLSTAMFYLSATRGSVEQGLWALLSLFAVLALVPRQPSAEVEVNWSLAHFHLTRVMGIIVLFYTARATTTSLRIYFSQTFNTRAYNDRVSQTMYYEHVVNTLLNAASNPWFAVLYSKLDQPAPVGGARESAAAGGAPESRALDPRTWQHLSRYINSHHVDGTELPDGFRHAQAAAQEDMDTFSQSQSKRVARRLFDRLFSFCEARRAVNKARKQSAMHGAVDGIPRTLSGSDLNELREALQNGNENSNSTGKDDAKDRSKLKLDMGMFTGPLARAESGRAALRHASRKFPSQASSVVSSNSLGPKPDSPTGDVSRRWISRGSFFLAGHGAPGTAAPGTGSNSMASSQQNHPSRIGSQAKADRRKIRETDFIPVVSEYYGDAHVDAQALWNQLLDPSGTGFATHKRFQIMVDLMFKGRRNISITLQDAQSVMHSLDVFIMSAFMLVLSMVALALYRVDVVELWVGFSGALLAWSFVFGSSIRTAFEAIVFLFAVHPYDVGDMIELGPTQERYEVRRIHLYSTELLRWDGSVCLMENRHIWDMVPIFNYSTSENKGLVQTIEVDIDCVTDEFLDSFRKDLVAWLASKPECFTKEHVFHARNWRTPLKCQLVLYVEHAYPNYSLDRTLTDQDKLMRFVTKRLVEAGVHYSGTGLGKVPFTPFAVAPAAAPFQEQQPTRAVTPVFDRANASQSVLATDGGGSIPHGPTAQGITAQDLMRVAAMQGSFGVAEAQPMTSVPFVSAADYANASAPRPASAAASVTEGQPRIRRHSSGEFGLPSSPPTVGGAKDKDAEAKKVR